MIILHRDLIGRRVRLLEKKRWLAGSVKGWSLGTLRFRAIVKPGEHPGGVFHVEFDDMKTNTAECHPDFGVGGEGGEVYFLDLVSEDQ